jgi:hypothetical protein
MLGLEYSLTDDNKGLRTEFLNDEYPSKEFNANFRAHFKFFCKAGIMIAEKLGAKVIFDEKNLKFEMKFD